MYFAKIIKKHGVLKTLRLGSAELKYRYYDYIHRNEREYADPSPEELTYVERSMLEEGLDLCCIDVNKYEFDDFKEAFRFPHDYHGGPFSGHWNEKIFEHYISYILLNLYDYKKEDCYIDVAASGSPWALLLRKNIGFSAYAIDLNIQKPYSDIPYYLSGDATATSFPPSSVKGISLHCAYEMFAGTDDINALKEFARILVPGGKIILVPLYMHTHYCCYSSPEFFGKNYTDNHAKSYLRRGICGVPSSRKYDVGRLKDRVLKTAQEVNLVPKIYSLRNQRQASPEIYCHFVLELRKSQ